MKTIISYKDLNEAKEIFLDFKSFSGDNVWYKASHRDYTTSEISIIIH